MRAGKRITVLLGAGLIAVAGLVGLGSASSAQASVANACNSYAAVLAGQGMECTVTVDNYVNGPALYSTVTIKECHGAAYTVLLAPACTTTVIIDDELVTDVTQCNGTLNGGGSNVTCAVQVNNHLSGPATPVIVTFNQCVGSGAGGTSPSGTPLNCSPAGLTIGATVTQCNGSVNGGGAPLRVNCSVPPLSETALPVLVNQCNGTVNGGGSVLFCSASFTNAANVDFTAPGVPAAPPAGPPTTTTTPSPTGGTFGTPGGPTFSPPAVGGGTGTAAVAAALAVSGTESTATAITAAGLIVLGLAVVLFSRRRIHHPAHRMG